MHDGGSYGCLPLYWTCCTSSLPLIPHALMPTDDSTWRPLVQHTRTNKPIVSSPSWSSTAANPSCRWNKNCPSLLKHKSCRELVGGHMPTNRLRTRSENEDSFLICCDEVGFLQQDHPKLFPRPVLLDPLVRPSTNLPVEGTVGRGQAYCSNPSCISPRRFFLLKISRMPG